MNDYRTITAKNIAPPPLPLELLLLDIFIHYQEIELWLTYKPPP